MPAGGIRAGGALFSTPEPGASPDETELRQRRADEGARIWQARHGITAQSDLEIVGPRGAGPAQAYAAVRLLESGYLGSITISQLGITVVPRGAECSGFEIGTGLDAIVPKRHEGEPILIDARAFPLYSGEEIEVDDERPGHIPGALSAPFSAVLASNGRLLPAESLKAIFVAAGVPAGHPVVVYCHTGRKAALVYLAARLAGYASRIYRGSWAEWSLHAELPAAMGGKP